MSIARAASFAGFIAIVLFVVGCEGDGTVEVRGTAQFDGQPIEDGSINFVPADGKGQTAGGIIKNGAYSAKKVPIGLMKVTMTWSKDTGRRKKLYDDPDSPERPLFEQLLPPKYSDPQQTELQYQVTSGLNVKDWNLEK